MSSETSCCCGDKEVNLIFACSGASNVGQLANQAAVALSRSGVGSMSCIAAIGAHLDGFVVSARDCDRLVVIDGCDQQCARKTFEHAGLQPGVYAELTELGFEKVHGVLPTEEQVREVERIVAARIEGA